MVTELGLLQFGDADLNKTVEFRDFLALSETFGKDGGWAAGDFDGSGQIQFADFLLLSTNYGKSATAVAAVPEPNAAMLLLEGGPDEPLLRLGEVSLFVLEPAVSVQVSGHPG